MSGRGQGRGRGGRNQGRGGGRGGHNKQQYGGGGRGQQQRGGRGQQQGGRGGNRNAGRGGGGGRGSQPDLSGVTSLLSNIVLASVTPNFCFYMMSIECKDRNNKPIESLSRRGALFNQAIWKTLLKEKSKKAREDLERVVFFSGSFFYSALPIEGLEPANLPLEILDGSSSDGDTFTVQKVWTFTAPEVLRENVTAESGSIVMDNRCSECPKAFPDVRGLLQHCGETGHKPVFDPKQSVSSEAEPPVFLSYANMVLSRALSERLAKWGREYIDPTKSTEAKDRRGNDLGVTIFQAFSAEFGLISKKEGAAPARLALTVDLRAKLLRSQSLLDTLYNGKDPSTYQLTRQEQDKARRQFIGETVIYKIDKKTYSIVDLKFDCSANTLPVDGVIINGKPCSHAQYFKERKNVTLDYPGARPMVEVLGRRKQSIFLPAELICSNELDRRVKEMLPLVASYTPSERNEAIDKIKAFLTPGAQKTRGAGGLLPACGIVLDGDRLQAKCTVMPVPMLMAAGVMIPARNAENWAPALGKAKFNIEPNRSVRMNVVVFHSRKLSPGAKEVYGRIKNFINDFKTPYTFPDSPVAFVQTEEQERHWGAVEKYFSGGSKHNNVFVLDFTQPRGTLDPAYPVVKQMLTKAGYLSQFLNFNTHNHCNARDAKDTKRSNIILQGVARQILQKAGVRLWWVKLPPTLPLPAVFVGVDVFHAPRVYDPVKKARVAKASCAAIIVQVVRPGAEKRHKVEIYSETFARSAGEEYGLQDALSKAVSNALVLLKVNPMACIVWRDGIGDSAFDSLASEEITGIRQGLLGGQAVVGSGAQQQASVVPLSYIVAQKRIATKFVTKDGKYGAPPGTLVDGIQGLKYDTFYIQGRAPPFSTPKPVRFVVVERDEKLAKVQLPELTWAMAHDYSNWPGPIKVPSVCMLAHKLAELGGGFANCGATIDHKAFTNTIHFL